MKILFKMVFLFGLSNLLQARDGAFEQTVSFIQSKVRCCSAPFSATSKRKVIDILITKKGSITLSYSDGKPALTFNILTLYKETQSATGIDTVMGGKFILFYITAQKINMIRFASTADAAETYTALLKLQYLCKNEILKVYDQPATAVYFIGRNTVLNTKNETLQNSIRLVDQKLLDTTVSISSNGEG